MNLRVRILHISLALLSTSGCMNAYLKSVGGDGAQKFSRIYLTDFNTAWQSVLDSLKNSRLDVINREGGFVQTRWTDNTAEKNLAESFGTINAYLKAQYRVRIILAKGFYNGQPTIRVAVEKEQVIQRDVLEGWRPIESDSIDENTLLYRIGRLIYVKMKFARIEEEKTRRELENSGF